MKKTHILLTTLLTTLFTATSCGETTPSYNPTQVANEAKIITAIDSLRGKTHQINISQAVTIVRPGDELSVDFTNIYEFTHTFSRKKGEKWTIVLTAKAKLKREI